MNRRVWAALALVVCLANFMSCTSGSNIPDAGRKSDSTAGMKVARIPIASDGPRSMDPVDGSTQYDSRSCVPVYETLLQYKYLVRPPTLEPLLLAEMPTAPDDGLTYHFKLKQNVHFHDDPCFEGGKGREMVAADVIYSWKRLADEDVSLKSWWLMENTVVGFDEYRKTQNTAEAFNYDAPVEGLKVINDFEFEVTLREPVQRFLWTLAMFQTSIAPREAVEMYGNRFARHPVGTGPFLMAENDWIPAKSMVFTKNPNYHECYYPDEHMPEDEAFGFDKPAGTRLPILDRVEVTFFVESQPMWLSFRSGDIDFTTVPVENYMEAFNKRTRKLKPAFRQEGIVGHQVPLLDFIFYGFNMDDELLGGYTDEKKYLRQAISLAMDWEERNDAFYNDVCIIYDGMIPPGLDGYPENGSAPVSYRGVDLERAKELLAKAGYPNGEGLPTLNYYSSREATGQQMAEMTARQLKKVGIQINPRLDDFSSFIEVVNKKNAPFFSFAWGSDYPDAENNLALFYGPNESPGANHFNYKNAEFDRLYERIRVMSPSAERTELYERMRDMVIEDAPFAGSLARTRSYLVNPWLKNFKPIETFHTWVKYLDIDESKRK